MLGMAKGYEAGKSVVVFLSRRECITVCVYISRSVALRIDQPVKVQM